MKENHFSIIIPAYNAEGTLARSIGSIISQSYRNWELIIVDDGSTDDTVEVVKQARRYVKNSIKLFSTPTNQGRVSARNMGMKLSGNEWICWLDADDEYMTNYLEVLNLEINRNPDYKIFNTGMLVKEREIIDGERYEKGYRIVPPFELKEAEEGMESFEKGHIGTGSFVFHRDLIWFFPENIKSYDGGDECFPAQLVKKDPIFEQICKKNESGAWLPLGNPVGDDYSYFWYLTRKHKSKMLNVLLYIQHIRV